MHQSTTIPSIHQCHWQLEQQWVEQWLAHKTNITMTTMMVRRRRRSNPCKPRRTAGALCRSDAVAGMLSSDENHRMSGLVVVNNLYYDASSADDMALVDLKILDSVQEHLSPLLICTFSSCHENCIVKRTFCWNERTTAQTRTWRTLPGSVQLEMQTFIVQSLVTIVLRSDRNSQWYQQSTVQQKLLWHQQQEDK